MQRFIARFGSLVSGVLSGFDRLVFRGYLPPLLWKFGIQTFLSKVRVRGAEFKQYALRTSERVKLAALAEAQEQGRPIRYLPSSSDSKEDLARAVLAERPIEQGLICAFSVVEPCLSFEFCRSSDAPERSLQLRPRKCLHIYQYRIHPRFGFMNVRLQSWFPFAVQICINGREWLGRRLVAERMAHQRYDNCFHPIGDRLRSGCPTDNLARPTRPRAAHRRPGGRCPVGGHLPRRVRHRRLPEPRHPGPASPPGNRRPHHASTSCRPCGPPTSPAARSRPHPQGPQDAPLSPDHQGPDSHRRAHRCALRHPQAATA